VANQTYVDCGEVWSRRLDSETQMHTCNRLRGHRGRHHCGCGWEWNQRKVAAVKGT